MTLSRSHPRAKQRWTLLGAVVLVLTLVGALAAQAQLDTTLFELDKDATNNTDSIKIGVLNSAVSDAANANTIQVCQDQSAAYAGTILIDAERMTLGAMSNLSGGGCPSPFTFKRSYAVTRAVDDTVRGAHAKAENVTRLVFDEDQAGNDWDEIYALVDANPGGSEEEKCASLLDENGDPAGAAECVWTDDGRAMSIFTSSKDYDEIINWQWRDQSVPDANELDDGFAVKYVDGSGDQHVFFGADRFATEGSKDAGFWFFQADVAANPLPPDGGDGTFSGFHTDPEDGEGDGFCNPDENGIGGPSATPNCTRYDDNDTGGDVLILTTFTGGGAVTTVRVYEWIGPAGSEAALLLRSTQGDCSSGTTTSLCATVNDTTIESPWPYSGKNEPALNEIAAGGFLEGGINLSDLGLEGCFSSFMAATRSSPSLTADPKDFILGSFEACDSSLTTTPKDGSGNGLTPDSDGDNLDEISIGTGSVQVTDSAVLEVKGTSNFTGDLNFFLCGPFATPQACSETGAEIGAGADVNPVTENGTYTSGVATITEVGRYCWYASFESETPGLEAGASDGTIESAGSEGPPEVPYSTGECFEVTPVRPGLSTQATTVAEVGDPISDEATLSGTANQPGSEGPNATYDSINPETDGAPAGGNILFELFDDGDTTCTGDPIYIALRAVSGDGAYPTDSQAAVTYAPAAAGTYRWVASYDGSLPNTLDATGACDDANETSVVVDARISITGDATNAVGDSHTFTVHVEENDGTGWADAANEIVSITWPDGAPGSADDSDCTDGTDADGECGVVINSAVPGSFSAHASSNVSVGGLSLARETDGLAGNSGDATKVYVDAYITIEEDDTNEVGVSHTFTINVFQDDGLASTDAAGDDADGFGPAPDGTLVTVSLTDANGAANSISENTCAADAVDPPDTDGTVNGECTITFVSPSAGTVTGHASVTFNVGGVSLTRETDDAETTTGSGTSNSGDAVKTFVDAYIEIAGDATNEVGVAHTFTVTVWENDGSGAGFVAAAGEDVDFTLTGSNGANAVLDADASTCDDADANTDTNGQCTIVFTSATAGQVTGHASSDVSVGGLSLSRETDGAETTTGSGQSNSDDAVKTFVDAYITINPPTDQNTVGDPHTFTVKVWQNDGLAALEGGDGVDGFTSAPNGTIVLVTLTDSGTLSVVLEDTCEDDDVDTDGTINGECTVTITSATAGLVTAHAAVTFDVGGEELFRETDGEETTLGSGIFNSDDAEKEYIAGSIAWTKVDNAGDEQGGATFELCRTHDYDIDEEEFVAVDPEPDCIDVVDDIGEVGYTGNDEDPDPGEFLVSGLPLGRYTVEETVAPDGFEPDPDTETVELIPNDTEKVIEEAFVNSRPILKITGFGYVNAPDGDQPHGILKGTTTYTVDLHNYGTADATLTNSSLVVSSNATCVDSNTLDLSAETIAVGATETYTLTCSYDNPDPAEIEAELNVKYTTNNLERTASGSPAMITFTVAAD